MENRGYRGRDTRYLQRGIKGSSFEVPKYFRTAGGIVNLYHHAKVLTRYLIENILKWNRDEVT